MLKFHCINVLMVVGAYGFPPAGCGAVRGKPLVRTWPCGSNALPYSAGGRYGSGNRWYGDGYPTGTGGTPFDPAEAPPAFGVVDRAFAPGVPGLSS